MTRPIRIVAPFRPFPPESELHRSLASFDWIDALRMCVDSAASSCGCPVHAITDVETTLPVPMLRYETRERRLMLWTLEACACYLASDDFDRDTVMLDVDQLVVRDLAPFFPSADLGVLMRPTPKHSVGEPLLNGVQFWSVAAKPRLATFYRAVLARARQLPEADICWGADTIALRQALEPLAIGQQDRQGLSVEMIHFGTVLEAWSTEQRAALAAGQLIGPTRPVVDFRWKRKLSMRSVYDAIFGVRA